MIISQIKNKKFLKILLILLILIISTIFVYRPIFKIKFGGGDNLEWYNEAQERYSFKKIIDYKYYSGRPGPSAYFNPVQLLVWRYMVVRYDKDPYPYHLLSLLIHIINIIIAFFLLKIFIKSNFFSFAATLSFELYYQNFKTIGWTAAGITTGLSLFFILSTIFLAIKYLQTKNKFFYFSSLLIFFVGTFVKEYVIFTIPLLLAYYLIIKREKILKIIKKDLFFFRLTMKKIR